MRSPVSIAMMSLPSVNAARSFFPPNKPFKLLKSVQGTMGSKKVARFNLIGGPRLKGFLELCRGESDIGKLFAGLHQPIEQLCVAFDHSGPEKIFFWIVKHQELDRGNTVLVLLFFPG